MAVDLRSHELTLFQVNEKSNAVCLNFERGSLMAGHSKWANIKHTKGAADAKRGKVFTKLAKEITVAAKLGGGDVETNPRLRRAVQAAKDVSMPKDNISRAIKRGTGEIEGLTYEEITYEGYGAGGAAILVDCLTDNKTRTVADVRFAFNKANGNMGEMGCVNWMFELKGELIFSKKNLDSEKLQEIAIDAGADDILEDEEVLTIYTSQETFDAVKEAVVSNGFRPQSASVTKVPQNTVQVEGENIKHVLKLMELLDDLDDVQNVYSNFEMDEDEMNQVVGG